ncbi:hypothetical protein EXIGLDRAFT_103680 [Exidia glandulosa HHB12029]|uniref:Uncharacterized protein n=1 Tax=Exidia glandulosa HHB12029 TaxID=1314781 RepID=A0A166MCQ5_EXIGL|nr:hypothetical protein EXIGLDRAFT_103680 [Exidia glandulosa HHB12029]
MVTMQSKTSKGSTDTASSPLVPRGPDGEALSRHAQDSPVNVDEDDGYEEVILTTYESPTTAVRPPSHISTTTTSSGSRRSVPGMADIGIAVRRVMNSASPRQHERKYEQLQ